MGKPAASALDVAVTHLNVPYGPVVSTLDLRDALTAGSLSSIPSQSANILTYMFVELDPALIIRCVNELKSGVDKANVLYRETLEAHAPRAPRWEKEVEHLI